jgi:hypothetical protein
MCIYQGTHTDTDTLTHTHTHTHTHAHTHAHTHTHTHTHTHFYTCTVELNGTCALGKQPALWKNFFSGFFCYLYMYCEELSVLWRNVFFFIFSTKILRFSFYFLTYICIYSVALNGLWKNNMFRCIVCSMT